MTDLPTPPTSSQNWFETELARAKAAYVAEVAVLKAKLAVYESEVKTYLPEAVAFVVGLLLGFIAHAIL